MHLCCGRASEMCWTDKETARLDDAVREPFLFSCCPFTVGACIRLSHFEKKKMKMDSHATNGLEHSRWENPNCNYIVEVKPKINAFFLRALKSWRATQVHTNILKNSVDLMVILFSSAGVFSLRCSFSIFNWALKITMMLEYSVQFIHIAGCWMFDSCNESYFNEIHESPNQTEFCSLF